MSSGRRDIRVVSDQCIDSTTFNRLPLCRPAPSVLLVKPMEPAYWEMRRIAQHVHPNLPELEYATLEVSPRPVLHPPLENDPDRADEPAASEVPLLSLECGRVVERNGWRVLEPVAPA